jgi:hypothetical protein
MAKVEIDSNDKAGATNEVTLQRIEVFAEQMPSAAGIEPTRRTS